MIVKDLVAMGTSDYAEVCELINLLCMLNFYVCFKLKIRFKHPDSSQCHRASPHESLLDAKLFSWVFFQVRVDSQKVLFACMEMFDYSARSILPILLHNIRPNPDISHEKLKGTLYILQYPRMLYLITHYWETMAETWPAIVRADQSEKPSVVSLINLLVGKLESRFDTLGFKRQVKMIIHSILCLLPLI